MKTRGLSAVVVACAVCLSASTAARAAVDATAKVKVLLQQSVFSAASDITTNTYFLKNASTTALTGPFRVVLECLDNRDVVVLNPDGYTPEGNPYFEYQKASLAPSAKTPGKPWKLYQRCGRKVTATVKPFDEDWQITPPASCSPLVTLHLAVLASEGGANRAPVAEAGPDQTVKVGTVIPLDGSLSTDEDGNPLTYRWSVVSKPAGGKAILSGATSVRPSVKLTLAGTYVLGLTVRDGALTSARDTCTLTTVNSRPVAAAGPDRTVELGPVSMDGGGSTDADGDRLGYAWSIVAMPAGAEPNLSGATSVRPSFMADTPGEYVLQLVVSHGTKRSFPDFCRISTVDSLPHASAGVDQKVAVGATVRLDGAGSSEVDGEPLIWRWALLSKPAGSAAALAEPAAVRPSFTADLAGTYVAQLTVNDGSRDSVPATVVVTTVNARPVAAAGRDQTAGRGARVTLDGSGSSDADGSALTWKWSLLSAPRGSTARLAAATTAAPSFTADKAGTYVVQLAVGDGALKSRPDTVVVGTANSPPAADAGADQDVYTNSTVNLDGSGSADPDGDFLTPFWAMLLRPEGSAAVLSDPTALTPSFLADIPGTYVMQLIVGDDRFASEPGTVAVTATVHMVSVPNVVGMAQADAESAITAAGLTVGPTTTAFSNDVPKDQVISQAPAPGTSVPEGSAVTIVVSLGEQTFTVPNVVGMLRSEAASAIAGEGLGVGTVMQEFNEAIAAGTVISQSPLPGATVTSGTKVDLVVSLGSPIIPPDPGGVAPPLDQTVASAMVRATEFIYSGDNAIQKGVEPGTIEARRLAVIRGRVTTRGGDPLPGVVISILDHPEYGQTVTRYDGMFDMAVNGGGYLTIRYRKKDHLEAQRQISTPWEDYVWAPDVGLVPLDPVATEIDLTSPAPIQVAQGSVTSDERGERRSTLLFPQGTGAEIVLPDGSTQAMSSLTVRATEYTVGENGPQAMPAVLPPGVEYTYAVELSVDEALAAGATRVTFSQPVVQYVENFLGFATGARVPVYYYDRERGIWVPSEDGRVIGILAVTAGLAEVDTNGDGVADDAARLAALGITNAELERLGSLYAVGQTLWRVTSDHFSPHDLNWPSPPAPPTPDPPNVDNERDRDDDCESRGSIIGCMNQTLGESIPIVGTPFTLNYRSDRVRGRKSAYTLKIPISGETVPPKVVSIELQIVVAGRKFTQSFSTAPFQTYTFFWDGHDAYGRTVQGEVPITVRLGYQYTVCYWQCVWSEDEGRWMCWENCPVPPVTPAFSWSQWEGTVGVVSQREWGIGGWSLDVNHLYDPQARILHLGGGARTSAENIGHVATTVAGGKGPNNLYYLDLEPDSPPVLPATERAYYYSQTTVGPDGSLYISSHYNRSSDPNFSMNRIIKVFPDGSSIVLAGVSATCSLYGRSDIRCYPPGYSGDGGPAGQAKLNEPRGLALAPDGSLYIADSSNQRIRRIGPDGTITTVAGNGTVGFSGDGGPAVQARLNEPSAVAFAPDGTLYIADSLNYRIRRVDPAGIITTVAGNGTLGEFSGDGGPASQAQIGFVPSIALGPDGSLYIADSGNARVRRVGTDGIITTVAGTGSRNCRATDIGDGGAATNAMIWPDSVAVARDGTLYVNDGTCFYRLRMVTPAGIISTLSGGRGYCNDTEGMPLAWACYGRDDVDLGPDGQLYLSDDNSSTGVTQVKPPLPGFSVGEIVLPSGSGREAYVFSGDGRHLQTIDALTGGVLYTFGLRADGLLSSIADGSGNTTTMERDGSGNPVAIIGPYGHRTTFTLDAGGYLSSIADPAGEATTFTYTSDGLMTGMTTPRGSVYSFWYDSLGRLVRDEDPAGGHQSLTRADLSNGFQVTRASALGRTTVYRSEDLPTGEKRMTTVSPDGTKVTTVLAADGTQVTSAPEGDMTTVETGPDPRFGMQSPILRSFQIKTPGGLTRSVRLTRSAGLSDPSNPFSLTNITDYFEVNNGTYQSRYDGVSRERTSTTPQGRQTVTTLDTLGRVVRKERAGIEPVSFTYDGLGRLTKIAQGPEGSAREIVLGYDSNGNVSALTDSLGRATSFERDQSGKVTRQILAGGREIQYAYDASGNLTSLTPPGRPSHGFFYNQVDMASGYSPPDVTEGGATTYTYNTDRQLTSVARPDGRTIALSYDPAGRLSTQTIQRGTANYTYEAQTGNVSSITAPGGERLSFVYDGSLMTGVAWQGSVQGSLSLAYDNNFRVVSQSVDGGSAVGFSYDSDGLLTQAGAESIGRDWHSGFVTSTSLVNVTDAFSYNTFGELAEYTASAAGSEFFRVQITRDQSGRIIGKSETIDGMSETYAYAYDVAGRLTEAREGSAVVATYTYDGNGNRLTAGSGPPVTATYDDQDRLLQYGNTTYTYAANGELASRSVGGQTTTYQYDELGNLMVAILPDGRRIDYVIDGRNRRIGKKVNGVLTQALLYKDRLNPVAELDAGGMLVGQFVYGTKRNVPDYMLKAGVTYRIVSDHLGSVRLVVDVESGAIVQRIDYDAFGNIVQDTNPGFQPFGFAGGLYDRDTKLTRFGARDYDGETGRWTAKDPILFAGGSPNVFRYVSNDPVNARDPDGREEGGFGLEATVNLIHALEAVELAEVATEVTCLAEAATTVVGVGVGAVALAGVLAFNDQVIQDTKDLETLENRLDSVWDTEVELMEMILELKREQRCREKKARSAEEGSAESGNCQ